MNELPIAVIQVEAIFTKRSIIIEVGNVRYTKQGLSGEDMRWERDICGGQSNIGDVNGARSLSIGEENLKWVLLKKQPYFVHFFFYIY